MATIRLVTADPPTMLIGLGTQLAPVDVVCCCLECALPDGDCPHALCLEVKFDETNEEGCDFIAFTDAGSSQGVAVYYYQDGSNYVIEAYAWGSGGSFDITIPADQFFNVWHTITLGLMRVNDNTVNIDFSVDGFGSGSFTINSTFFGEVLNVGNIDGCNALLSIRSLKLVGNPDSSEVNFNFPADSFDSFTGGASIVDGQLRIDDTSVAYATKSLTPAYNMNCVLGACCIGDHCSILSQPDCIAAGGIYQGNGTPCDPNPCIPGITLVCDQISSTLSKCGFTNSCTGDGKVWLTRTDDASYSVHDDVIFGSSHPHFTSDASASNSHTYDPVTCMVTDAGCSGSGTQVITCIQPSCVGDGFVPCSNSFDPCASSGTCWAACAITDPGTWTPFGCDFAATGGFTAIPSQVCTSTSDSITWAISWISTGTGSGGTGNRTLTYSDEYTTTSLISNVMAALPDYDDDFNDTCQASMDLSDDESTYSIARFKPKFQLDSPLTYDVVICYNEHFAPEGGGSPTDTPKTVTIPAGDTEVVGAEVLEPSTDGVITITDVVDCTP